MRAIVEARDPGVNFSAVADARRVHFDKALDKATGARTRCPIAAAWIAVDDDAVRKIHR